MFRVNLLTNTTELCILDIVASYRKDKMITKSSLKKRVEVARKYKIESYGYGVPFPEKTVHQTNSRLMDFAFSLVGGLQ